MKMLLVIVLLLIVAACADDKTAPKICPDGFHPANGTCVRN